MRVPLRYVEKKFTAMDFSGVFLSGTNKYAKKVLSFKKQKHIIMTRKKLSHTGMFLFTILSVFVPFACSQKAYISPDLTKLWETPAELKTPESVLYDYQRDVYYVSNVNGNPSEKDGNGFISRLKADGTIENLQWITGLNAPKGMGLVDSLLYVSDIDEIVEMDVNSGKILNKYPIPGSKFLNDITCDEGGRVFVSDMQDSKIYVLSDGKVSLWLSDPRLDGVNGLLVWEEDMYAGVKNAVLRISDDGRSVEEWIHETGGIDGLVTDGKGNFIFSDWTGHVYKATAHGKPVKLLDTTPVKMNAADIDFILDKNILLVPTFFDNRVVAYLVK